MPKHKNTLGNESLAEPPSGWIRCGVCGWPVYRSCFTIDSPPENSHQIGSLEAAVHRNALPTVTELEGIPGLRAATPGWNNDRELTHRALVASRKATAMKKPAQAMKRQMEDPARSVKKKPAAKRQ